MKYVQSIWQDIKVGKNIDVYIAIGLALIVAVLNIFNIAEQVVSAATLAVLALVSYSILIDRRTNKPPIIISADNDANIDYLCKYISNVKIANAKIIQYSGDKISRIVELLLSKGAKVELLLHYPGSLLQHPDEMLNRYQLNKIYHFQQRANNDFKNRNNLIMRFYKESASVRAIKLDDSFLSMGWYTYRNRDHAGNTTWLYGHNNATIITDLDRFQARDLVETFDKIFQALWETSFSYEDIEKEINLILNPFWIKAQSD